MVRFSGGNSTTSGKKVSENLAEYERFKNIISILVKAGADADAKRVEFSFQFKGPSQAMNTTVRMYAQSLQDVIARDFRLDSDEESSARLIDALAPIVKSPCNIMSLYDFSEDMSDSGEVSDTFFQPALQAPYEDEFDANSDAEEGSCEQPSPSKRTKIGDLSICSPRHKNGF